MKLLSIIFCGASLLALTACQSSNSQLSTLNSQLSTPGNPYMPLWERIPDGEPYVFEDPDQPGKYRVYVYGSHDDLITAYCGRNLSTASTTGVTTAPSSSSIRTAMANPSIPQAPPMCSMHQTSPS